MSHHHLDFTSFCEIAQRTFEEPFPSFPVHEWTDHPRSFKCGDLASRPGSFRLENLSKVYVFVVKKWKRLYIF